MRMPFLRNLVATIGLGALAGTARPQTNLDNVMPVRGFCIAAPRTRDLDEFIAFISSELPSRHVNTLILMVNYNYQYKSHPELMDKGALSQEDVKKLVNVCRTNHLRIIPQIDLLGHQSWAGTTGNLLRQYPEFDETPQVKMPAKYQWPNPDGLYCKSYCPLHPKVHEVVFSLMDELCDAFEADAFHAGMDEVFYIGDDKCPRCACRDKAGLFANEVRALHDHLALKGRSLWMWGDRLLDGRTTGLGMWEASYNNTGRAIDLIPKDVTICDWHYEHRANGCLLRGQRIQGRFLSLANPGKCRRPGAGHGEIQEKLDPGNEGTLPGSYADGLVRCQARFWPKITRAAPAGIIHGILAR